MTDCPAAEHGTRLAYKRGCRCPLALRAIARYENERRLDHLAGRPRMLPNIGALRRLRALRALGWPSRELARRIGVDERNVSRWAHRTWISRAHHEAVCRVYDELADHQGPDERARRHAARQGWLVPLWWDDDTIDDPTFDPIEEYKDKPADLISPRAMRQAQDAQIVATLTAQGLSAKAIAERIGSTTRRVVRLRALLRAAAERQAS